MECSRCGATPALDPCVVLLRQNPLGEMGVWLCTKCNVEQIIKENTQRGEENASKKS